MDKDPPPGAKRQKTADQRLHDEAVIAALPKAVRYNCSHRFDAKIIALYVYDIAERVILVFDVGLITFFQRTETGLDFIGSKNLSIEKGSRASTLSCFQASTSDIWLFYTNEKDTSVVKYEVWNFAAMELCGAGIMPFESPPRAWVKLPHRNRDYVAAIGQDLKFVRMADDGSVQILYVDRKRHRAPVCATLSAKNHCISIDETGSIEYWKIGTGDIAGLESVTSDEDVTFKLKMQTDLYVLKKRQQDGLGKCLSAFMSPNKNAIVITCSKKTLTTTFMAFVFQVKSGRLFDEFEVANSRSLCFAGDDNIIFYRKPLHACGIGARNYMNRTDVTETRTLGSLDFTATGIDKTYDIAFSSRGDNVMMRLPGLKSSMKAGSGINSENLLLVVAKQQLLIYGQSEAEEHSNRDFDHTDITSLSTDQRHPNHRPSSEQPQSERGESSFIKAPATATIYTTAGDIQIKLEPELCPKTVENFAVLAQRHYYDGLIFHRVIQGFMIQTGDPLGDGTGGTSIWGEPFEDEFNDTLDHNVPFVVSMANAGPKTNGSQFFITTAPCEFLNHKHTVFGSVIKGHQVCRDIECVKTNVKDKPLRDIRIVTIKVSSK